MRVVTFKIEEDKLERLDSFARIKGVTRSELIRKAIELYLDQTERLMELMKPRPRIVKLYS